MRALLLACGLALVAAPLAAAGPLWQCTLVLPGTTCTVNGPAGATATVRTGDPFFALLLCDTQALDFSQCLLALAQVEADVPLQELPTCQWLGNLLACLRPWASVDSGGLSCASANHLQECFEASCTADWPTSRCSAVVASFGLRG